MYRQGTFISPTGQTVSELVGQMVDTIGGYVSTPPTSGDGGGIHPGHLPPKIFYPKPFNGYNGYNGPVSPYAMPGASYHLQPINPYVMPGTPYHLKPVGPYAMPGAPYHLRSIDPYAMPNF